MKIAHILLFLLLATSLGAQNRVIITGLVDGTGPGAKPRALELYVDGTVDLADYRVQRYANGNTEPTNINLSGSYTDAFVYVVNGIDEFAEAFGGGADFANIIASGSVTGTGDDVFALLLNGQVVDLVGGNIGERENIYQDSYLYRISGTGPDPAWTPGNWTIPGNDVLDDKTLAEHGTIVPFGSYVVGSGNSGPDVSVTAASEPAEPGTDGSLTISLSEAAMNDVSITYSLAGTATRGQDYLDDKAGTLTISAGLLSNEVTFRVIDDNLIEGTETIDFAFVSISDSTYTTGAATRLELLDDDLGTAPIGIHLVQGGGETSPLAGNFVTVQAVVTATFKDGLQGFFIQEEDADVDEEESTSEGIFVFAPAINVAVGNLVTISAEVEERFGQTQLRGADAGATITVDAMVVPLPSATELRLPRADTLLEYLEGMRVTPVDMVITDVGNLARFGELSVTSSARIIQYTECNKPDSAGLAVYTSTIAGDILVIDDGRGGRDLNPVLLPNGDTLSAGSQVRAGQSISGLTGVLGYGFGRYRVQPTSTDGVSFSGNERPTAAPLVGGTLKIVSANVLNYFTTLGSRGADSEAELMRQEGKIIAALIELDADIVGLIEMENNDDIALARLTNTLSASSNKPYSYVVSPNSGDDQIKVALIYRSDRVTESGTAAALAEPASLFVGRNTNRVPLAQTFRIIDADAGMVGEEITVCVNHLKSKGGSCGSGDDDEYGGAGSCNGTRTAGARAIAEWLATDPTGTGETDILIVGDLNAYRMEEPIVAFELAGYQNTKTLTVSPGQFPCGGGPPSYVFGGQWGSLDYALASPSLAARITGATAWTVNAPEPSVLDYNTEGASDQLYAPDYYRFSDHDPIVVGIDYSDIIDKVSNSAVSDSRVELRRSGQSSYTFEKMTRRGRYFVSTPTGQVIMKGRVNAVGGTVDLAGLPAGVYFIVVREAGYGQATFKVLR